MKKFAQWFTLERRQGIQLFVASVVPILVLTGISTQDRLDQWMIIVTIVLQFISSLLSLLNLRKGQWSEAWVIVRGAIYTLGLAAAPALVALGYWNEDFSTNFVAGLALTLTMLSNFVAVLTGSQQKIEAVEAKAERAHPTLEFRDSNGTDFSV